MSNGPDPRELRRILEKRNALKAQRPHGSTWVAKGIGPNKACGHKGGIQRQGSKRG